MGPKTKELIEVLYQLEVLLQKQEEFQWCNWVNVSRERLLKSDFSGIEKLLGAYGGMGSFNDLVVGYSHDSGATQKPIDQKELNNRLSQLRSKAYTLATEIKRNVGGNHT